MEEKNAFSRREVKDQRSFGGSPPFLFNAIDAVNNAPLAISNIYCTFAVKLGEWNVFSCKWLAEGFLSLHSFRILC